MSALDLLVQERRDALMGANKRLDSRFVQTMNGKDVEGAMTCFLNSRDLVVVLHSKVLRDPSALRQFLTELFSSRRAVRLEINEITQWSLGETVFAVGTATYKLEALDGTKSTLKACRTNARQKIAGRWVYVLDHATQIQ